MYIIYTPIYIYVPLPIYISLSVDLAREMRTGNAQNMRLCRSFSAKSPTLSVDCSTNLKDKHKGMQCICLLSPFLFVSFLCMQR